MEEILKLLMEGFQIVVEKKKRGGRADTSMLIVKGLKVLCALICRMNTEGSHVLIGNAALNTLLSLSNPSFCSCLISRMI